jgi:hypothetical protein
MMVLNIHVARATSYEIGQESLADAIRAEAEIIATYAGADLLEPADQAAPPARPRAARSHASDTECRSPPAPN